MNLQPTESESTPQPFEYVIAETPQGRYVGYVDAKKQWFRVVNNTRISNVTSWYAIGSTAAKRKEEPEESMEVASA